MTQGLGPVARDGFEIDKLVPGYHRCRVYSRVYLLECKYLTGKNEIISYIHTYEDLFRGDIEDQI